MSTSQTGPTSGLATPPVPPNASVYLQRETMLGKLSNLWRQRCPMDTWAPLEIALFESAMCIHGKGKLLNAVVIFFLEEKKDIHQFIFFAFFFEPPKTDFGTISRIIRTKSTKDVIEFYYFWKHSSHYHIWKTAFHE